MKSVEPTAGESQPSRSTALSCAELVRVELQGKFAAVERYDSMLWKIRSGYLAVLYGTLALLGGSGLEFPLDPGTRYAVLSVVLLIWTFSACAFLLDLGFLLSKLRVVGDSNELYRLALESACGKVRLENEERRLQGLLRLAGESRKKVGLRELWRGLRWVVPLYLAGPVAGTVIYALAPTTSV